MYFKINLSDKIKQVCPEFQAGIICANVTNSEENLLLWEEITTECERLKQMFSLEQINQRPSILATRNAYKRTGKDPNRYRPSAEALTRRVVRNLGLYRINTLVDLINLVSLRSGYSIGGFDAEKIMGDELTLGIGRAGELFHGIGRGPLNIEGLPVYRDAEGGIGTPTSDEERTKITLATRKILIIINSYGTDNGLLETTIYTENLLKRFADANDIEHQIIRGSTN
ncbi:MAG TPA: hypothetical protein IAB03_07435 [Candidatus Gallibacteroides avistercoris]|uniref:B3/B4 tRNA-binding domain-containing protein n=1 Tax=Candidatus Gallibacteroides avistercoris TaxID=2840833 RepID=A0A9D1M8U2_9BACT|nr:hypothetical protein [Candidatus Gallibacteroides avistercoris]